MIFEEKQIGLRDGRTAVLKSACVQDAAEMLDYVRTASGETDFLLRYPEEWRMSVEQEEAWIRRCREDPNTLSITCYVDGRIVANCDLSFQSCLKAAHRATIAVAVLKAYWRLGIGAALMEEMTAAARKKGAALLELEVMEGNERARRLYEVCGFRIVSERPDAYRLKDGVRLKSYLMHKEL